MADDQHLLREYVRGGSRAALADLVQRHLALVYSAALRQVRDPHLAEDVTQAVFLVLVQKGATIKNGVAVGGWLLAVTRYAALNALKQRTIEQRRERMLAKSLTMKEDPQDWEDIAPHLDAELHRLSHEDRDAVVLRFFQNRSFAQIAAELCVSEDTAQKRVSRALDRLRRLLTRRGMTLPAAAVATAISAHSVQAAPAHLLAAALSATGGATATAASTLLAKGVLTAMHWTKLKIAAGLVLGGLLLGGAAVGIAQSAANRNPSTQPAGTLASVVATVPASGEAAFDSLTVKITTAWPWNRTVTIQGDGTYVFEMQMLEPVAGRAEYRGSATPYVTGYRMAPGDVQELGRLMQATEWLGLQVPPGPPVADAMEYAMTLQRKGVQTRALVDGLREPQAYADLVRFLRGIERQEEYLYAVTHPGAPGPSVGDLGAELDAMTGAPSRVKPYAPALDYHRLVPAYVELLGRPDTSPEHRVAGIKLLGHLQLRSQRKLLESLLIQKAGDDGNDVRSVAAAALGRLGANESLATFAAAAKDPTAPSGAIAEALMTAPPEKALPILKELAARSSEAAWALIRTRQGLPTILDLLYQPGNEEGEGRAAYFLIRAWNDHWNEVPAPLDPKILSALHDRVAAGDGSLIVKYGKKVLNLADDPVMVRNAWQQLESTLALMAAPDQAARRNLLLPLHFRNNRAPGAFLDAADNGELTVRRVLVERSDGWAHVVGPGGRTHYSLFLSNLGGTTWVIEAAQAGTENQVQARLDQFLPDHPNAVEVSPDEAPSPDPADLRARNKQALARVAAGIMKAVEGNDVAALERLSAGSSMGWLSASEAGKLAGAVPAGWSKEVLAKRVQEIRQTYRDKPQLMQELAGVEARGDWAAVQVTSPQGKIADPSLMVLLQRMGGEWRLADLAPTQGPLVEDLERQAARMIQLQEGILGSREVEARLRAIREATPDAGLP